MKDLRLTFDEDPVVYDRVRPSYPPALFDDLWRFVGKPSTLRICEAGAGTGKATASLLALGARVTAVEIGTNLASFMQRKFARYANLLVVNGPFESAMLPIGEFDVVFSATAWHWMDPDTRLARAAALLRAGGGVLAVVDTIQVKADTDNGYFDASQAIYRKYEDSDPPPVDPPGVHLPPAVPELRNSTLFADPAFSRYRWDQTYSRRDYQDLMRSYSNMRAMQVDKRESLIAELGELIDARYDGRVTRPLEIGLTMARKA